MLVCISVSLGQLPWLGDLQSDHKFFPVMVTVILKSSINAFKPGIPFKGHWQPSDLGLHCLHQIQDFLSNILLIKLVRHSFI